VSTVAVIGAGIGGLSTAIRAAAAGRKVTLFEAGPEVGGKLRQLHLGDYRFDLGPSLFTWPALLQDTLASAGPNAAPFDFLKLDRSCHYFWPDGTRFTAWSDRTKLTEEIQTTFGMDPEPVLQHLDSSQRGFEATRALFLEQSLHESSNWRPKVALPHIRKALKSWRDLPLTRKLNDWNRKTGHPQLQQLFNRYATYNGSDPFRAPAMLHVIPHLEFGMGTFAPIGGMHAIVDALHRTALNLGVDIRTNAPVEQIQVSSGRVQGVVHSGNQTFEASVVVSGADVTPTYQKLLKGHGQPHRILNAEPSTSGVIFYWGMQHSAPELHLHNILWAQDYKAEFQALFAGKTIAEDPTVYINIGSKTSPEDAPEGAGNWFVMVNAPAGWDPQGIDDLRQRIEKKIEAMTGIHVAEHRVCEHILTPKDIAARTGSHQGALYGPASNAPLSAFLRQRNRDRRIKGLYFAGGSVHPGGGIPLCLLSGRITHELMTQHDPIQ
jgi:diapolycopene oxygenase